MNLWFTKNKKAFNQSMIVFVFLFGVVILMTLYYDFSQIDLGGLLFLMSFLSCVFIAKSTFDTTSSNVDAEELKKSIAVDLAVSSEELYVQLYKNSPVPYIILDFEGLVKSANISAVRLFGTSKNNIDGIDIFKYIKSDKLEHIDFLMDKFHNGVSVSDEMVRIKRPDHREAWALLSLFGFKSVDGRKIGLLTLVDITRQKKAEDAKSEFVSLASHQLRTPISGMKWSAELLQMDSPETLTERQLKYIDRLLVSIKRMAFLVDDFLRVSRFELGTFKAEYRAITLSVLFEDIMLEQSPRVTEKKITVKTFYDSSIDTVMMDQNLLRMIVTNLYSNAVKYTRESGTIHVGFGKRGEDVVISIADNGMGIPAEDQDSIFSKLFRASNAVRDVPDGTGLGLYIVREAVAVLKGQVSFTTTENIGTTFEVILPLELPEKETGK